MDRGVWPVHAWVTVNWGKKILKMTKKIIFILFVALIGVVIGNYASFKKSKTQMSIECINSKLYDLNVELDIFEHWKSKYNDDQVLEEKIKHLILNNVVSIYIAKPDINNLKGVPLDALHRLILINKKVGFSIKKFDHAFKPSIDYLSFIENDVNDIWNKKKENQKRPFK